MTPIYSVYLIPFLCIPPVVFSNPICPRGFHLIGNTFSACIDGEWSNNINATCLPNPCSPLILSNNITSNAANVNYTGGRATLECPTMMKTTWILIGPKTTTCTEDGVWTQTNTSACICKLSTINTHSSCVGLQLERFDDVMRCDMV